MNNPAASGNTNGMMMEPDQQGNFGLSSAAATAAPIGFGQNWNVAAAPVMMGVSTATNPDPAATHLFDQTMNSMDIDAEAAARNRGNYRCSKCGEPKKGHICAYQPMNFKCNRCGNPKKNCTCGAPDTREMAIQCERDENMTTRLLDLSQQGVTDFHGSVATVIQHHENAVRHGQL